ncbi:hypothetical protein D9613_005902 [Agrocybe pediades]|uniref:Cytochrome P450 n=1 Tax=Agrocybe pediades TaxID=84607 RepID=A0A8H4VPU4_9AGAR|nr:hypothetical protein D9613_005902 [Agrocybe pediades]
MFNLVDNSEGVYVACCAIGIYLVFSLLKSFFLRRRLPYPPGPPEKSWLSGNLSDIPTDKPWVTYTNWKDTYGDIIHLRVYGQHTIILNSLDVAKELMEQRPKIYSDRPYFTMVDLMEWSFNVGLMPYGDLWRSHRRIFQQSFRKQVARGYEQIQTQKVVEMLRNLLETPDDFREHYKTVASASIVSVVYGFDLQAKGDPFVDLSEAAVEKLSNSVFPGSKAVNALPILKHLPEWFPGAGFQRYAREARIATRRMRNAPFELTKKAMSVGTAVPSIVAGYLSGEHSFVNDQLLKDVAATSYAAGSDTTASALGTFFLAMAMFPDVQKKAQQEIDAVTEGSRLVTLDDRQSLLYTEAVFREILRWRPVLPLGVAHCAYTDDVFRDYYIPKGCTVIINTWALSRDPEKYDEPEAFKPERYFDEHGNLNDDEVNYAFGFGRRQGLPWPSLCLCYGKLKFLFKNGQSF